MISTIIEKYRDIKFDTEFPGGVLGSQREHLKSFIFTDFANALYQEAFDAGRKDGGRTGSTMHKKGMKDAFDKVKGIMFKTEKFYQCNLHVYCEECQRNFTDAVLASIDNIKSHE